eukprot:SAG22_NODE_1883_length_3378_cov_3.332723_2_plen_87_part_00
MLPLSFYLRQCLSLLSSGPVQGASHGIITVGLLWLVIGGRKPGGDGSQGGTQQSRQRLPEKLLQRLAGARQPAGGGRGPSRSKGKF